MTLMGWMTMGPVLASNDGGLVTLVMLVIFGVITLLGKLVEWGQKRGRQGGRMMPPGPGEAPPVRRQKEGLEDVRQFFQNLQAQTGAPSVPASPPVPTTKKRHRRAREVPAVQTQSMPTEGPAEPVGYGPAAVMTSAPMMLVTSAEDRPVGLERLVDDPRLPAGARAVVLMEVLGTPRSLGAYRGPAEGF